MSDRSFNLGEMLALSFVREYAKAFLTKEGITGYTLKFICDDCVDNDHAACIERNKGHIYSSCDCGHGDQDA